MSSGQSLRFQLMKYLSFSSIILLGLVHLPNAGGEYRASAAYGDLEQRIADLPEATPENRLQKAFLDWALGDARSALAAGRESVAEKTLHDIEEMIGRAPGGAVIDETRNFQRPISDPENNPILKKYVAGMVLNPAQFSKGTVDQPSLSGDIGYMRRTAAEASRYAQAVVHPGSPFHSDPQFFLEAYKRIHAFMDDFVLGHEDSSDPLWGRYDFFTLPPLFSAAVLLEKVYPDLILPVHRELWSNGIRMGAERWKPVVFAELVERNWVNRDLAIANIMINAALFLGDESLADLADTILNHQKETGNQYPDGGFAYTGKQNECAGYHSTVIHELRDYWLMTSSPVAEEFILNSRNYYLMTVGENGFDSFWTAPTWKYLWNTARAGSAHIKAMFIQCPFNLALTELPLMKYDWTLLEASLYNPTLEARRIPEEFLVYDRNLEGPRGRLGRFIYGGSARVLGANEPGKMNFMGAMITNPHGSGRPPLNSALKAIYPRVNLTGDESWNQVARHSDPLTEENSVVIGENFASLTTSHLLQTVNFGPTARPVEGWSANQQWLALEDRIIGMIEVHPNSEQTAHDVTGRIRLGYGRAGPREAKEIQRVDETRFTYGDLKVRLHGHNYGSVDTEISGILRDDFREATEIVLRDPLSENQNGSVVYGPEDRHYFIAEIGPNWTEGETDVSRIATAEGIRGLKVTLKDKLYVLLHNLTNDALEHTVDLTGWEGVPVSVRESLDLGQEPIVLTNVASSLRLEIAAHQSVLITVWEEAESHWERGTLAFDELLVPIQTEPLSLGEYRRAGDAPYALASDLSDTGGKLTFQAGKSTDSDTAFLRSDFETAFSFTEVGQKVEYTFTFDELTIPIHAFAPQMRTGFVFASATVLHRTSMGAGTNLDFRRNDNNNLFSSGSPVGEMVVDWADSAKQTIRFRTGETIRVAVSLELVDIKDDGAFRYAYSVSYENPGGGFNTATQVFDGVASSILIGVFHGINWTGTQNADGMSWRVRDASALLRAPIRQELALAYDDWVLSYGLQPDGEGAPNVSASGDGIANFAKYAMGQNPAAFAMAPEAKIRDGFLKMEYTRNLAVSEKVTIVPQAAPAPTGEWTQNNVNDDLLFTRDGIQKRVARTPVEGDGKFLRLLMEER